jgi:hypothetical protein
LEFHAIVAKSAPMRFRRPALIAVTSLALLAAGGALIAQMEAGERGILPVDSSGTLEISGVKVDVGGKNAEDARFNGWRLAQRQGFRALWARIHGRSVSEAPNLPDSALDGLVSSIVVEREQIGPNRYIATLGVLFDRARAGQLLGVPGQQRRSAPMLLIPVTISGGAATSVELRNPWQRAWAQFRTSQSPVDYVRVSGLGVDPLLVNAAQTMRRGRGWWRNVLDLYGAANILVAEVKLHRFYPGGPARGTFTARFGPDNAVIGRFELIAKDSADIPRMMTEGVARMDQLFVQALNAGIVRGDPDLIIQPPPAVVEELAEADDEPITTSIAPTSIRLLIAAPNGSALSGAIAAVRGTPGVVGVSEGSVNGGTTIVNVLFRGEADAFRAALAAKGWGVAQQGNSMSVSVGVRNPPGGGER